MNEPVLLGFVNVWQPPNINDPFEIGSYLYNSEEEALQEEGEGYYHVGTIRITSDMISLSR